MNIDGSGMEIFANGVRNTVGFAWHPLSNQLWFTDNGSDGMGNDVPADELNNASKAGMHFGFPYCQQGDIPDPEFGKNKRCSDFTPPVQKLGPHVAALGMRFYTGNQFPAEYKNQIFIAEHGSWNRSEPIGYRVSLVKIDSTGKALSYSNFAEGWLLPGGKVLGRPVDVQVMPDGALLVSDDYAGVVYRIVYNK
jgi:glucose/arabinose dehydrogenase